MSASVYYYKCISGDQIKKKKWTGQLALTEDSRDAHRVLVGKPDGKMPLGRPRRR